MFSTFKPEFNSGDFFPLCSIKHYILGHLFLGFFFFNLLCVKCVDVVKVRLRTVNVLSLGTSLFPEQRKVQVKAYHVMLLFSQDS